MSRIRINFSKTRVVSAIGLIGVIGAAFLYNGRTYTELSERTETVKGIVVGKRYEKGWQLNLGATHLHGDSRFYVDIEYDNTRTTVDNLELSGKVENGSKVNVIYRDKYLVKKRFFGESKKIFEGHEIFDVK